MPRPTLTRFVILVLLSNLLSLWSHAGSPPQVTDPQGVAKPYLRLAEHTITGARFELAQAQPSFELLFYAPSRREFIVHTQRHSYRYRRDGELLGLFELPRPTGRRQGNPLSSGVHFFDKTYVDWDLSGEAEPKPYASSLSDADLDDAALTQWITTAAAIDHDEDRERKTVTLFLQRGGRWSRIDSQRLFPLPDRDDLAASQKNPIGLLLQERVRVLGPALVSLRHDERWTVGNTGSPLQALAFQQTGKSRSGPMDLNSHGWDGVYGHGYFRLDHEGDALHFQIETAKQADSKNGALKFVPHLRAMHAPDAQHDAQGAVFLALDTRPHAYRPDDEVGLYVLRPIQREPAAAMAPLSRPYPWRVEVNQLLPRSGQWRELHFFNGTREMLGGDFAQNLAEKKRPIPSALSLYWKFGDAQAKKPRMRLFRVQNAKSALDLRDQPLGTVIVFRFDRAETESAFAQLGQEAPIALRMDAEQFDIGDSVALSLVNPTQRIPLLKVEASTLGLDYRYDRDDLDAIFMRAKPKTLRP